MSDRVQNEYQPDYVSPPGETLQETLETIGMSQAELARRTGRPSKTINEIVQGKAAITPETALQLERVLGIRAGFWIRREQQYRESLARQKEEESLAREVAWLKEVPVRAMVDKGWIQSFDDDVQQLREVLSFFGVASQEQWRVVWRSKPVAFRQSPAFQADPVAVAAWLREGELTAQNIECAPYDEALFREVLLKIRALTVAPPDVFQPELIRLCAGAGVAVAFVPQLPKTRASGATCWLTPKKALIQISLRYKSNDQLWFTFFHEAGHILLHGKRAIFLEDEGVDNEQEQEADKFAADMLIPPADWQRLVGLVPSDRHVSKAAIRDFAAGIGIAPGIVVGRLQHEGLLPYSHCNDLKVRLAWADD
jgi:HTH-type transcriptional regulator/antitoxin HigA